MPGAARPDVNDTRLAVDLRRDALEDRLHHFPCARGSARHDAGALPRAFFPAAHAGSDETQALRRQVGIAPLRREIKRIAAVDDDVVRLQQRDELLDDRIHRVAVGCPHGIALHHDLNLPRALQALHEFLQRLGPDQLLAGVLGDEFIRHRRGAVEDRYSESAALDVEDKILSHHGKSDQSEVSKAHWAGRGGVLKVWKIRP